MLRVLPGLLNAFLPFSQLIEIRPAQSAKRIGLSSPVVGLIEKHLCLLEFLIGLTERR